MFLHSKHRPGPRTAARLSGLIALLLAGSAGAQALKYSPTNPHFGGNPFNGADLMSSAAAQKSVHASPTGTVSAMSSFASNLDARISAGLAQYISNQLFSATGTGGNSGSVTLGTMSITYARNASTVDVVMRDTKTGETQTASYPLNIFVP